jgi:hypothetical protein
MPADTVYNIVGRGTKQIDAYNICDGTLTQSQIARKTGIDQGNLSRTFSRWVHSGIAFWVGEGKEARLLHIYSVPKARTKGTSRKKKRR